MANSIVERLELAPASHLLLLGRDAARWSGKVRERGHRIALGDARAEIFATDDLARAAPFDGILAAGFLEFLRWDRWALRHMHTWLKPGGVLVLVVPNLFSPLSLLDPRYVGRKIIKQVARLSPGGRAMPQAVRESSRSYHARSLLGILEEIGFEIRRVGTAGPPVLRNLPGGSGWLPTHHVIVARRRSSLIGLDPDRPFPDPRAHRARYEDAHRAGLEARDAWRLAQGIAPGPAAAIRCEDFAGSRILVLAPHPDDEIIGCGGTLLRLVQAGAAVTVLQATDGASAAALQGLPDSVRRTVRLREAELVAQSAGFEQPIFWKEANDAFAARPELVERLRATLSSLRPTAIFTPFLTDLHPDHRTLNRILASAMGNGSEMDAAVFCYEVWGHAAANAFCDVSAQMPRLEELLRVYDTAMKDDDFVHMLAERNYYNSLVLCERPGHVEAFFRCQAPRFRELVTRDASTNVVSF